MKKLKREGKKYLKEANAKLLADGGIEVRKLKIKPLKFKVETFPDGSGYWYYASAIKPILGFEIDLWETTKGIKYKPFIHYHGDTQKLLSNKPVSLVQAIKLCNKTYIKIIKEGKIL